MKIKMDFKSDWHETLLAEMANDWGVDISGIEGNIPVHYFNAAQRRIRPHPRTLLVSDSFSCPPACLQGWDALRQKVVLGESLVPHLSKGISEIGKKDQMLNDWGVYHLHLGTQISCGYVGRTGPLLFAKVTDEYFYAVGIYDHGAWCNSDIVETIHRNWPSSIAQWIVRGLQRAKTTDTERAMLRRRHTNAFFTTSDGTSYGAIGGGMVSSGHNVLAVINMDTAHDKLEDLERYIRERTAQIRPSLMRLGYEGTEEVIAKLSITGDTYGAFFPQYGLLVNLIHN